MSLPTQYDSPSFLFARDIVNRYSHAFPNNELPTGNNDRATRVSFEAYKAGQLILERIDTMRHVFNNIVSELKDLEKIRVVREYEKKLSDQLEVLDVPGFNYQDSFCWDVIKRALGKIENKGIKLVSTRGRAAHIASGYTVEAIWRGIQPEETRRDSFLAGHTRLREPLEGRRSDLRNHLVRINVRALELRMQPNEYNHVGAWVSRVSTELKRRSSANPHLLIDFMNWIEIVEGVTRVGENPRTLLGTRLDDETIRRFVDGILSEPLEQLPAYTPTASLRRRRRIGLRQAALRPELKTYGFARDGGLYI